MTPMLRRVLALCVIGSAALGLLVGLVLTAFGGHFTLFQLGFESLISFGYALVISSMATVVFSLLRERLNRAPAFAGWAARLGILLACAVAGTLVCLLFWMAIGVLHPGAFWRSF